MALPGRRGTVLNAGAWHGAQAVESPRALGHVPQAPTGAQENDMAKGLNQKKQDKKKPEKSLKEKRAEKAAKKSSKS